MTECETNQCRQSPNSQKTRAPRRKGAPKGNSNRKTHGAYSRAGDGTTDLADAIADLQRRLRQLSHYIDDHMDELDIDAYTKLVGLQGNLTSRLGRLIGQHRTDDGDLATAINTALDEISAELGIEL